MSYDRAYYLERREETKKRVLGNYAKKDKKNVVDTFQAIREKFGFSDRFIRSLLKFYSAKEILSGRIENGRFIPKEIIGLRKTP